MGATCVLLQEGVGLSREAEQSPKANKDRTPARGHLSTPRQCWHPPAATRKLRVHEQGQPLPAGFGRRSRAQAHGSAPGRAGVRDSILGTTQAQWGIQRTRLLGLPQNQTNLWSPITKSRVTRLAPQLKASQTQRPTSDTQTTRSTEAGLCLSLKTPP